MKNLFMFMALSVLLFTACNNDLVSKKDYDQLVQENLELRERLAGSDPKDLRPISYNVLKKHLDSLEIADSIKIPISLTFEKKYLNTILKDTFNHMVQGIIGYPIFEKGYLKIALVPYYTDSSNNNAVKHFDMARLGAHNYSDMCPPSKCASNRDSLGVQGEAYKFVKQCPQK